MDGEFGYMIGTHIFRGGATFLCGSGTIVSNALSNSIPGQYMAISGHVFTNDCIVSGHVGAFVF